MSSEPPEDNPWLIDFFEEDETHENAPAKSPSGFAGRRRKRSSPRSIGASSEGRARAARLALAVVVVLAVAVIVIVAVKGGSEATADGTYLTKLSAPASDSERVGTALASLLRSSPSSSRGFETSLRGLLVRQEHALSATSAIAPPPRLRTEQQQAVSAMQFRVDALSGLLYGFREAAAHPAGVDWAAQLSIQAQRLIASDVIWHDFFVTPADAQAASDGDGTPRAPTSTFVADADLTGPSAMAAVLSALQGHAASTTHVTLLKLGARGPAVTAWQRELNLWIARQPGLTKLPLTGVYDQLTVSATMAFQTAAKLSVDGVAGPMTRAALASALAQKG